MLDPSHYGLPKRTVLEGYDNGVALVVDRKSRIVMADGRRIVGKADKIREHSSGLKVVLKTTAPVCSKTILFLAEHDIAVISLV